MDQYVTVPTVMQNSLHPLSTSSIIACHLLDFMVQGKITEADALMTVCLNATPSGLSVLPTKCPFCCNPRSLSWLETHTHTCLTALFLGLPGWAGTRKVKSIWILLKQETVSGTGISRARCKSASRSRQITTPVPHHSGFFYRLDALPVCEVQIVCIWSSWCHCIPRPCHLLPRLNLD